MEYAWKHKYNIITKQKSGENGSLVTEQLSFKLKTDFTWHMKHRKEMQRISAHGSFHPQLYQMLTS